ncbi:MAG: GEVED domain-containing protein [Planctomycetota bacterium]
MIQGLLGVVGGVVRARKRRVCRSLSSRRALFESLEDRRVLAVATLSTIADGEIRDNEHDGVFDVVELSNTAVGVRNFDFATFKVEEVAVFEFDTSSIPANATLNSIDFEFDLASFTSSTNVSLVAFAGDGVVTLSDATATGTLIASISASDLSLGINTISITDPTLLASAIDTGGVTIRVDGQINSANMQMDSIESSGAEAKLIVDYEESSGTTTTTVSVSRDAQIVDNGLDGTFDVVNESLTTMSVRHFSSLMLQELAVFEFETGLIPDGDEIVSATFQYRLVSYTSSSEVIIDGFAGDGVPTLSDATAAGSELATIPGSELSLGVNSAPLDVALISDAIRGDNLTIRVRGLLSGINVSIAAEESTFFQEARLVIEHREIDDSVEATFPVTVDAHIEDQGRDGVFDRIDEVSETILVRDAILPVLREEFRGVFEFDTSSLPAGAQVDSVRLDYQVSLGPTVTDTSEVYFEVYNADGVITLADATTPATLVGTRLTSELGVGPGSIELESAPLAAALASGFVGIRARASVNTTAGFASRDREGFGMNLVVSYTPPDPIDFGDAPDSYRTSFDEDGARHVATGPQLGAERDSELDAASPLNGEGDDLNDVDDEDGVMFGLIRTNESTAGVNVDLQNADSAHVDAWLDFDQNGVFDVDEKILDSQVVSNGLQTLNFTVPPDALAGETYARVRVSSDGNLQPFGVAADGEVEDYRVPIYAPPTVESISVNEGSDSRSVLTSLTVLFDTELDDHLLADAFTVTNITTNTVVSSLIVTSSTFQGGHRARLTFGAGPSVVTRDTENSLEDGNYRLDIDASKIRGGGDVLMEANVVFGNQTASDPDNDDFFRLFGDDDGDGDVDGTNYGRFGQAFLKTIGQTGYDENFDGDGDGDVDGVDYGDFGRNFLTSRP